MINTAAPLIFAFFLIADAEFCKLKPLYNPGDRLYVLALSGLSVRQDPVITGKKLLKVQYGETIKVLMDRKSRKIFEYEGIRGFWVFSEYNNIRGYMFDGFLSRLPAPNPGSRSIENYLDKQIGMSGGPLSNFNISPDGGNTNLQISIKYKNNIEYTKSTSGNEYKISVNIRNIRVEEAFLILKLLNIDALNGLETFPVTNMSVYYIDIKNNTALLKDIKVLKNDDGTELFDLHARDSGQRVYRFYNYKKVILKYGGNNSWRKLVLKRRFQSFPVKEFLMPGRENILREKILTYILIAIIIHGIILIYCGSFIIGGSNGGLNNIAKNRSIDLFTIEDSAERGRKKTQSRSLIGKKVNHSALNNFPGNKTQNTPEIKQPLTNTNQIMPGEIVTNSNYTLSMNANSLSGIITIQPEISNIIASNSINTQEISVKEPVNEKLTDIINQNNISESGSNETITISSQTMMISSQVETISNETAAVLTQTNVPQETGDLFFNIGEKIDYDVEVQVDKLPYIKGTVGTVEVKVKEVTNIRERPVFHCTADVRSLDSIINLYVLKDFFETWFDAEFLETYQIEKNVREGGWLDYITNFFHSGEGYGIVHSKSTGPDGNRYDMLPHSYDIITLLFFLRITEKDKPLDINWVADFGQKKNLKIEFSEGGELELNLNGKKEMIRTLIAHEKDTGITVYLAKDYDNMPVKAVIPAFKIVGYTINLNATFKRYLPGQKTQKNW